MFNFCPLKGLTTNEHLKHPLYSVNYIFSKKKKKDSRRPRQEIYKMSLDELVIAESKANKCIQ